MEQQVFLAAVLYYPNDVFRVGLPELSIDLNQDSMKQMLKRLVEPHHPY
jgi:hypothetical protein